MGAALGSAGRVRVRWLASKRFVRRTCFVGMDQASGADGAWSRARKGALGACNVQRLERGNAKQTRSDCARPGRSWARGADWFAPRLVKGVLNFASPTVLRHRTFECGWPAIGNRRLGTVPVAAGRLWPAARAAQPRSHAAKPGVRRGKCTHRMPCVLGSVELHCGASTPFHAPEALEPRREAFPRTLQLDQPGSV